MNERDIPFLGTGWSFPPHFTKEGKVAMTTAEEDIKRSLQILLSTAQGERVMNPDYGCNLDELMFESLSTSLKTQIIDAIETAILYHEPRILVEKIELVQAPDALGRIDILIEFIIKTTNARTNYVYPYYLNEASSNL